jgi:anti-anti-sigma regulatory factor
MPPTEISAAVRPAAVIDRDAVALLVPELGDAAAHGAVRIDGSAIEQIGQAGLQLLLSARRSADAAGAPFAIVAPSQPLCRAAQIAGLSDALSLPDAD